MTYDPNQHRKLIFVGEYDSNQKKEGVFTTIGAGMWFHTQANLRTDHFMTIVRGLYTEGKQIRGGIVMVFGLIITHHTQKLRTTREHDLKGGMYCHEH